MASLLKTITEKPGLSHCAAFVLTALIYLTTKSMRWRCIDKGGLDFMQRGAGKNENALGVIVVNWHSRILGMGAIPGGRFPVHYMSSPSRDGKFIARVVKHFGFITIWGSSNRAAISGTRAMLRTLKGGGHIGLTPDGPRGPARKAAAGVVRLAAQSGAKIVPIAFSAKRMARLGTWDRLAIPCPFTSAVEYWGAPIAIARDTDTATACRMLEDALNTATAEADAHFGHAPDHVPNRYGRAQKSHRNNDDTKD